MQSTWDWAIPCWGKVAVARGKRGLGKVANVDWHEISAYAIKTETIRSDQKTRKFATCPLLPDPRTRSNTCASGRGRRATRGAATSRHVWLMAAAVAGPTRRGQATCAAVLAQPRARLRAPPFTSSASPRARVQWRAAATARTDATELWAPGALRLPLSGSTTHAQSQR